MYIRIYKYNILFLLLHLTNRLNITIMNNILINLLDKLIISDTKKYHEYMNKMSDKRFELSNNYRVTMHRVGEMRTQSVINMKRGK